MPSEHSSGSSRRGTGTISRIGSERLRRTLLMGALSARRTNKALANLVDRMTATGKPPKVVLIAVARKLLVLSARRPPHADAVPSCSSRPVTRLTGDTIAPADRAEPDGFVERFNGTVLEELFRPAMHARLLTSFEAPQADLDARLHHDNHQRPHLGYRIQGQRPWETVDMFVRQEDEEDR